MKLSGAILLLIVATAGARNVKKGRRQLENERKKRGLVYDSFEGVELPSTDVPPSGGSGLVISTPEGGKGKGKGVVTDAVPPGQVRNPIFVLPPSPAALPQTLPPTNEPTMVPTMDPTLKPKIEKAVLFGKTVASSTYYPTIDGSFTYVPTLDGSFTYVPTLETEGPTSG